MRSSEIRIKRRELMNVREVADLLRSWANQIDAEQIVSMDGLPISVANLVFVRQDYKRDGNDHTLMLKLSWEDTPSDQPREDDSEDLEDEELDNLSDPDENEMPTPLDLPGRPDEQRAEESK